MARTTTSTGKALLADPEVRWRPTDRKGQTCHYVFRGVECVRRGAHYCQPRADRVMTFFARALIHTRGALANTAFILEDWQEFEIIRPLFGEVRWSKEFMRYVRRYRIGYICVARKNGKSELAAGIQLYMLIGDGEEAAEIYSAAKDTAQAEKVFEPARLMVQKNKDWSDQRSPSRVEHFKGRRRLVYRNSVYQVLTSDAKGELGHNPHCFNLDEVLAMPDASMWQTMTTAVGARTQELIYATTTETNDSISFGAGLIDEAERIQEDPTRAPHIFSFVRKLPSTTEGIERLHRLFPGHPHLPVSTDPFDERNWKWPNPALDRFKSRDSMQRQALEAQDNVEKENGFRQYQVNQRVQQVTRYISLDLWDQNIGELALTPDWQVANLRDRQCWAGLDLSSKLDLTAWCLHFNTGHVIWRYWVPESVVPALSLATGGEFQRWVTDGWITETDGDTIDYEVIYADIARDCENFKVVRAVYDKWSGEPVRQRIVADTGLEMLESDTTFSHMTGSMNEAMRMLTANEVQHGGNPVSRWMADNLSAKRPRDDPDRIRPVKPDRAKSTVRIDGMPAWFFALEARALTKIKAPSKYETNDGLIVL